MDTKKVIVIGNGMVGQRFVEQLREADAQANITVLCEEPRPAYDRVALSSYFESRDAGQLALTSEAWFSENDVTLKMGVRAETIDRRAKSVQTDSGETLHYDELVLATGSYPFVPPIPGNDHDHCFVYRTIEDLDAIIAAGKNAQSGVVVGGGLLGLEAANALKTLGLKTHVVEFAPRLMAVQIDDGGGKILRQKIEDLGVSVHVSTSTQRIEEQKNGRLLMQFADETSLETDLIVFSAGVRPSDALAKEAGLNIAERGGVMIDNHCRTSDPNIWAVGECASWNGQAFGLVAPGYQMAKVAAACLANSSADGEPSFTGADMSTKLKLLGVDVASIGDAQGNTPGATSCVLYDEQKQLYKKLVMDAQAKKLLGAVLVGDASEYGNLLQIANNGMDLPENPETLILPSVEGGGSALGVDALPDSAQICSCNDVSKGAICSAVEEGAMTMAAVKDCTKAATSCGGCAALTKQILDRQMEQLGMEVNTDLCEHFPHTRQDLEAIIRVEKIRSFSELIEKHGQGLGCDICKPAVGSILASTWNEFVLKPHLTPLQDTNDRFLANMQKDGTYSVVPRVPGGEITPDKLIVIGEVAKKYDLYTKITGGQRIDLFGAQLHELPKIWDELIAAGFESGHAYGKAVRTVKSCVGSTWCRYGVQDSVTMAIDIENRYRGIRSPHKLKFAVSGCTRECAEAQSKDVGVIATENGWNLYICGNGGMKPRHADLLATDLNDEELIRYIDRFLIFYVRTADRLQRTSVWMDNLEGGLDYVKQVVLDDSLGIADELEAQMQQLVDSYECEWKKTLDDPVRLQKFSHFINDEAPDSNVVFVKERAQIRPATTTEKNQAPTTSTTSPVEEEAA